MNPIEAIQTAQAQRYQVLDIAGKDESERFFLLAADPISEEYSKGFAGKDVIATCRTYRDEDKEVIDRARMMDMQDDVAHMYGGKESETYKKIIWTPIIV